jgi:hypothetical protein
MAPWRRNLARQGGSKGYHQSDISSSINLKERKMYRANTFRPSWSGRFAVLALLGMLFTTTAAHAGCAPSTKSGVAPLFSLLNASLSPVQDDEDHGQPSTIVGLWHVIYTATYSTSGPLPVPVVPPDTFVFAESFKTWHGDGTEWEEKIAPPPGGGFCYGVWKHTANGSVKLHHVGVITAPDGSIAAIFYEDEINRVAPDGKTYSGSFDFKLYAGTDVLGTGTVLQEIKGTTAATRITVD